ncbi:cell division protein ZipA [mine drainage metagenome]|uniref:Cell division protein ZipA n=1 Tax=mine drainage metagenome TaxID=410659 RepID=A0A1J5QFV8_9ZZZZ
MSDMQLYLIALGAVIIAAVILYNWWQERRLSQDAIQRFDGPEDDALMQDFPIDRDRPIAFDEATIELEERYEARIEEPAPDPEIEELPLEDIPLELIPENTLLSELPGVRQEHQVEEASPPQESGFKLSFPDDALIAPPGIAVSDLPSGMDEQIDLIALVQFDAPLTGAALLESLQPLPGFDKATQWCGRDESGAWHVLDRTREATLFSGMAGALQFSDRSGALSRECLRKFQLKIETLAEALGAESKWRGMGDPLRYADELDQFCIDVDVMVVFHLLHGGNGPFAATKLRGIAEAGGMKLHEDGTFHYATESGNMLFSLINHDQRPFTPDFLRTAFIRGVTFQMDVPRVMNCLDAFNQMVLLARKMESSLDGVLIDDKQQTLNNEAMDKIREQLRIIYAKMVARNITPGSPSALRLFS